MSTRRRQIGMVATAAAALLGFAIATPAIASSASPGPNDSDATGETTRCGTDFTATGVNIRSRPALNAAVRGLGNRGDCVRVHASGHGGDHTCDDGVNNNFWYDITDVRTGVRGWVSSCYLPPGT